MILSLEEPAMFSFGLTVYPQSYGEPGKWGVSTGTSCDILRSYYYLLVNHPHNPDLELFLLSVQGDSSGMKQEFVELKFPLSNATRAIKNFMTIKATFKPVLSPCISPEENVMAHQPRSIESGAPPLRVVQPRQIHLIRPQPQWSRTLTHLPAGAQTV